MISVWRLRSECRFMEKQAVTSQADPLTLTSQADPLTLDVLVRGFTILMCYEPLRGDL